MYGTTSTGQDASFSFFLKDHFNQSVFLSDPSMQGHQPNCLSTRKTKGHVRVFLLSVMTSSGIVGNP